MVASTESNEVASVVVEEILDSMKSDLESVYATEL